MKITYLVNEQQADGSIILTETTSEHWHKIIAANKTAPANERRYFYADIISDNYNLDWHGICQGLFYPSVLQWHFSVYQPKYSSESDWLSYPFCKLYHTAIGVVLQD